jgi:competence protein ComEA
VTIWEHLNLSRNTFVILLVLLAITFGCGFWVGGKGQEKGSIVVSSPIQDLSEKGKPIRVYICGEVKNPGVYEMTTFDCVEDAVKKAGWFNETADSTAVNLARSLKSGEQIIIKPRVVDLPMTKSSLGVTKTGATGSKNSLGLININTATQKELMELPGIGEVKANAIIAYRELNGFFTDTSELDKVSGIGPKTMETLLPLITVN